MGRHSSPRQGPFYRSIIVWALPWLMIAAVVLVAIVIAIDTVGGDDIKTPVAAGATQPPEPEPTVEETPSSEPVESTPEPRETPKDEPKEDEAELITDVTVQVLNGTGVADADDRMADRLSGLGYEVVAIEGSSKQYASTTVFWSHPDAQDAAEALAERFGWLAQAKPDNLSATVDLHVVVGGDEA